MNIPACFSVLQNHYRVLEVGIWYFEERLAFGDVGKEKTSIHLDAAICDGVCLIQSELQFQCHKAEFDCSVCSPLQVPVAQLIQNLGDLREKKT